MEMAFPPCLVGTLNELPVVEASAKAAGDRMRLLSAAVAAEAVVGEAQRLGDHPTFAVILPNERLNAFGAIAIGFSDSSNRGRETRRA